MMTNNPRTLLSISPNRIEVSIGQDLDDERRERFLSIIDGVLDSMIEQTQPVFGHFSFSKNRVEVTLSRRDKGPDIYDLTYNYPW